MWRPEGSRVEEESVRTSPAEWKRLASPLWPHRENRVCCHRALYNGFSAVSILLAPDRRHSPGDDRRQEAGSTSGRATQARAGNNPGRPQAEHPRATDSGLRNVAKTQPPHLGISQEKLMLHPTGRATSVSSPEPEAGRDSWKPTRSDNFRLAAVARSKVEGCRAEGSISGLSARCSCSSL
jgi:hypothetical protein